MILPTLVRTVFTLERKDARSWSVIKITISYPGLRDRTELLVEDLEILEIQTRILFLFY